MDVLSVLVEIRDLLELSLPDKRPLSKKKKKTARKPQTNGKVEIETKPLPPVWNLSPYPIETFQVGTAKIYPFLQKGKVLCRISHVNGRMKKLGLPNHFRHRVVVKRAHLFLRVWRDK